MPRSRLRVFQSWYRHVIALFVKQSDKFLEGWRRHMRQARHNHVAYPPSWPRENINNLSVCPCLEQRNKLVQDWLDEIARQSFIHRKRERTSFYSDPSFVRPQPIRHPKIAKIFF